MALYPPLCIGDHGVPGCWLGWSERYLQCLHHPVLTAGHDGHPTSLREEARLLLLVVELNAEVVGMVAAAPPYNASDRFTVELKRLSVKKECRRRGVATALCKTVLNFAKEEGYKSVMLETSTMQLASIRLYEGILPTFIGRILQFYDISYKYELSEWNR
ncbi:hypothetical protein NDU88_006967 [Pleurodeles waltl]|uniref:N-acetyltransferase domain-containing protein n=1 Tax=Pleurodeles waltl TaxID=8319 RepID=A0AAV7WC41_PLEWA|nr:hypothetical protein NDU88_006967 [Pleurodeles waltl]